jgi:hypothetical protein
VKAADVSVVSPTTVDWTSERKGRSSSGSDASLCTEELLGEFMSRLLVMTKVPPEAQR